MSKLKILAGVVIAGMWIFRDLISTLIIIGVFFGFIGGVLCLAR